MGIFESHAHYDDEAFDEDRKELLKKLPESGIEYVVNVGASCASTRASIELAAEYDYVYAAVGVHPNETAELDEEFIAYMKNQAMTNPRVVAIGEIGLDYYWNEPEPDIQKKWFIRQLDLALETDKPVIIHSRDAAKDTADILLSDTYKDIRGVIYCYSYSPEIAKSYLDRGFYLGVGGVVTYKNARKLVETVDMMPLSQLLIETDSPYLSPAPNRGKRNSSLNLPYIIDKIAQLKGITPQQVIEVTNENARRLFSMPDAGAQM